MPRELVTERLVLRAFTAADGDAVVRYLGDFQVSRWLAQVPHPFSHDDLMLVREGGQSRWPELMAITFEGVVVGAVINTEDLGYWIAPELWGQGFATEATSAVIDRVFRDSPVADIRSGYLSGNAASARVLQKLGFTQTGQSTVFVKPLGKEAEQIDLLLDRETWVSMQ